MVSPGQTLIGLLGPLLGVTPVLGPILQDLGCSATSLTSSSSAASSTSADPVSQAVEGASSVVSRITSGIASPTGILGDIGDVPDDILGGNDNQGGAANRVSEPAPSATAL